MSQIIPDKLNGLTKVSAADSFQIRSVSEKRFVKKFGIVSESVMEDIRAGLSKELSIETL